jgi:hypothetical protein
MIAISQCKIEFYERGKQLIETCRCYAVPRQGEYVNIDGQQWRVAYVSWALDKPTPMDKIMRANVELEKVADDEVGPVK